MVGVPAMVVHCCVKRWALRSGARLDREQAAACRGHPPGGYQHAKEQGEGEQGKSAAVPKHRPGPSRAKRGLPLKRSALHGQ
jgi:hypothetical protein